MSVSGVSNNSSAAAAQEAAARQAELAAERAAAARRAAEAAERAAEAAARAAAEARAKHSPDADAKEAAAKDAAQRALASQKQAVNAAKQAAAEANQAATDAAAQAKNAQTSALQAKEKADATGRQLDSGNLPGGDRARLATRYQAELASANQALSTATSLTQRAAGLQQQAIAASNGALSLEKQTNATASSLGQSAPYAAAQQFRDVFDLAKASAATQTALVGSTAAVGPQEAAARDAQKLGDALKSGGPLAASRALVDTLNSSSDPAYRTALMQGSGQTLRALAQQAEKDPKPDKDQMQEIADNLAKAGELTGVPGSRIMAAAIAPSMGDNSLSYGSTHDGKPVFNAENLDGALANSAVNGKGSTLFRLMPAAEQAIGKADSADWKVHKSDGGFMGFVHGVEHDVGHFFAGAAGDVFHGLKDGASNLWHTVSKDPLKAAELMAGPLGVADLATGGHVGSALEGAAVDSAKFVGGKLSDAERSIVFAALSPVTNAVNGSIRDLKPGENFSVKADAEVEVEAGIKGDAQLQISRGHDGSYTVSAGADVAAGCDFGFADGMLGGGGRVEFKFNNEQDAERAADAFARVGASAAVPGMDAAVGAAELTGGDLGFLKDHLSAVELKASAAVEAKANLGLQSDSGALEGLGLSGKAAAQASAGMRVELDHGKVTAVDFGEQVSGSLKGSAAMGPANAGGQINAAVTAEQRLQLKQPLGLNDLIQPGKVVDAAAKGALQTGVSVSLSGSANFGVDDSGFKASDGWGLSANARLNGDPAKILKDVLPGALHGDFSQAMKSAGKDVGVEYSVLPTKIDKGGFELGLDVLGVGGSFGLHTSHCQVGDPIASYRNARALDAQAESGENALDGYLQQEIG